MMSVAFHYHQRDVLSRNHVVGNGTIRYGSDNRTIAFSSSNPTILAHSFVKTSFYSFHHPWIAVINVLGRDLLSIPPISPVSFPESEAHQPLSIQVTEPPHLSQPSSTAS